MFMRKLSSMTSLILLASILALPQASAANAKAGEACARAGATSTVAKVNFTCVKSGKKLVWNNGEKVAGKVTTPTSTPKKGFYQAPDSAFLSTIYDTEGCAVGFDSSGKQVTTPILQAFVNGDWLDVKTIEIGWEKKCNMSQLPNNKYFAYAKAKLEDNLKIRWKFIGPINIASRDEQGNGYSKPTVFLGPTKPLIPHQVEGGYGITWENITRRINDISAAAWTDAQLTLIRNAGLPNAANRLTTYITPNAAKTDGKLDDVTAILKKTFTLLARVPAPSKIFFVALTHDDVAQTELAIKKIYPSSNFMIDSIESMYGTKPTDPKATVFTFSGCDRWGWARNTYTYPNTREAGALILGVCPPGPGGEHRIAVHVMSHEYVHLIQIGLKPNSLNIWENIPCWMIEGEPEWVQSAMSEDFSTYLIAQMFHPYLLSSSGRDYSETTAREWSSEEVLSYYRSAADFLTCRDTNKFAYGYSLGAATTEALVSIGGSESFFALHERLILGENMNNAFKTVYGITWDAAAPILAQVVAKKISLSWSDAALTYQTRPKV